MKWSLIAHKSTTTHCIGVAGLQNAKVRNLLHGKIIKHVLLRRASTRISIGWQMRSSDAHYGDRSCCHFVLQKNTNSKMSWSFCYDKPTADNPDSYSQFNKGLISWVCLIPISHNRVSKLDISLWVMINVLSVIFKVFSLYHLWYKGSPLWQWCRCID